MATDRRLRLVIVTPETTLLDQDIRSVRFPLFDGQMGVLPGRAPLVGKLGYGELRYHADDGEHALFIDGGFVQIKGSVVSILTGRAIPVEAIDRSAVEAALEEARLRRALTDEELAEKQRDQQRARAMLALVRGR
ncbi:MAG: ATP synthase F1 subunit epsilon [Planctomycetota bacterium]|nr:MAG: ATP synthase F1 subunit epsilon [Planctomycetota bacterium]